MRRSDATLVWTGDVRWSKKLYGYDAWNFACDPRIAPLPSYAPNCPSPSGNDLVFGQSPMLLTATLEGETAPRDLLAVGQKSGVFWALDPARDGAILWATPVGPGGSGYATGFLSDKLYALGLPE